MPDDLQRANLRRPRPPRWLVAGLLALALAACAPRRHLPPAEPPGPADFHDRLAQTSQRLGFHNGIHTLRQADRGLDYTFIPLSLDGIKRRHDSLENLLAAIGRICARPEFAGLRISIEVRAADAIDRDFIRDAITRAAGQRSDIRIAGQATRYSGLVVAVAHDDR